MPTGFRPTFAALLAGILMLGTIASAEELVIAHRGASGYLPEHTLEAYALAYGLGADYIEPDLVLTKDDVFICLHDIHLEGTTDVEERFPDRAREDGRWYALDFTLDEIKTLRVHERLETRFEQGISKFEVPTFTEMVELVQGINAGTGREVGIYPEIKAPAWHRDEGHPVEEAVINELNELGYSHPDSKVFLQCFEPDALKRIRTELKSSLKLIQLISDVEQHAPLRTREGITQIAEYADGIGPFKGDVEKNPALVEWAHSEGMLVHPYTFRADDVPESYRTFNQELRKFYRVYGVDGLFTDFPGHVIEFLNRPRGH